MIDVLVELDAVDDDRLASIMSTIGSAVAEVEARPVRMPASVAGREPQHPQLADALRSVDGPYYRRFAG